MTDPLIYNTSAANIKAALEALPTFQRWPGRPLTVTVNQALSAGAAVTFTFDSTAGNVTDLLVFIPGSAQSSAPAVITGSCALTTPGIAGFTTTTYDIYVYGYQFYKIQQDSGELNLLEVTEKE